ncbi:helix-turn-helix domain-containing protein [Psychromonas sp. Urea-02u-13]|uniref:helix-turn-helix domain-containing protein n=1 Tax=Psychromonas sp. Urea-02u-13 TaxID=2058326 RepID=UPI000C346B8B|nr:helix-turn-helix domain-containing protein [Psychromonas sp. Urea-02u-13]PKG37508.1 transcriptional regulator [Psychromonas sp. Urea-02u-13]
MNEFSMLSANDVQVSLCEWLITKRKEAKLSRAQLAQLSTVPASTIKKFETTQQISFRQFILLWQSLDELVRLNSLTKKQAVNIMPSSIAEVLGS